MFICDQMCYGLGNAEGTLFFVAVVLFLIQVALGSGEIALNSCLD